MSNCHPHHHCHIDLLFFMTTSYLKKRPNFFYSKKVMRDYHYHYHASFCAYFVLISHIHYQIFYLSSFKTHSLIFYTPFTAIATLHSYFPFHFYPQQNQNQNQNQNHFLLRINNRRFLIVATLSFIIITTRLVLKASFITITITFAMFIIVVIVNSSTKSTVIAAKTLISTFLLSRPFLI